MSGNGKPFVIYAFILYLIGISCHKSPPPDSGSLIKKQAHLYNSLILSEDTLTKAGRIALVQKILSGFQNHKESDENSYHHYFKGRALELSGNNDSASYHYRKISCDTSDADLSVLKQYLMFDADMGDGKAISAATLRGLLAVIKIAEQRNSVFLYRLYDLAAKSYYTQKNVKRSMEYTDLYFRHHPFRENLIIRQRYYDISCMLAFRMENKELMCRNLDSARRLAILTHDSLALMRTYDYESQFFAYEGQFQKAVESSRIFFRYLQSHNMLQMYAFNNLATSFEYNGQLDSAIHYYKESIEWSKEKPGTDLVWVYEGLGSVYRKKGNYKNAAEALDSAMNIFRRNVENAQAEKIEELRNRYHTEKKDQAIASLQTTQRLNRKIISQERWFFASGLIMMGMLGFYFYNQYRRKLLMEKNEKLLVENKKLRLEQKMLQLQLNPHFIYNSIANLQGLISSGEKKEASSYLRAFSNVMRSVLELNREDLIPLREEIEALENYIRLQQMRFKETFEYSIDTGNVDMETVLIPPMLLQPFVENAIEHGFKNIDYKGKLRLSFTRMEDQIHISIEDNGRGIIKTGKSLKKSLSQSIIRERLDLLFNQQEPSAYFEAKHPVTENGKGYEVNLYIPLLQS